MQLAPRTLTLFFHTANALQTVSQILTVQEWEWGEDRVETTISKSGDWAWEELSRFLAARRKRHGGSGKAPTKKKRARKSPF
jgi:hypothetical protein